MKIGLSVNIYTNYEAIEQDGRKRRLSVSKTKYSLGIETRITKEPMQMLKAFVGENIPELAAFGIAECIY